MLSLIDGNNIVYRAFYGKSGLIDGFKSYLQPLPEYLIVVFDGDGINWRNSIYSDYKKNRGEKDPALVNALDSVRDWLIKIGVCVVQIPNHEGDDVIASLATKISSHLPVLITSADHDYLQLIDESVRINQISNKGNTIITQENCKEIVGVESNKIIDLKAMVGDKSDNYGGIYGIGQKIAISLLNQYGSLESIYEHIDDLKPSVAKKLIVDKEMGFVCKSLATMKLDLKIPVNRDMCRLSENTAVELLS